MIEYKSGDIFTSEAEALVNTVNCVGVMGRGVALQFKNHYPENFKVYQQACENKQVKTGQMFVFETGSLMSPKWIINFPTKRHWRGKSHIEDIDAGLTDLVKVIREKRIQSIAIPPLGAGLGGLDWLRVRQLIETKLAQLKDIDIEVYEPSGAPAIQTNKTPRMTIGRAALIELMYRYLNGLLDPSISLLEVHKLLYFMQEAGEPLRLNYKKHHYGPYAENLRHVLRHIEGHFTAGYSDGGDEPYKELKLLPHAREQAQAFLQQHESSVKRFEKVSRLVEGFETAYGLELLATVHWLVTKDNIHHLEELIHHIHTWNKHKQAFTPRQIKSAYVHLQTLGWLN